MAKLTDFRKDARKTPSGRNSALIKLLQGSWANHDIEQIERDGLDEGGGWKVTYHEPAREAK